MSENLKAKLTEIIGFEYSELVSMFFHQEFTEEFLDWEKDETKEEKQQLADLSIKITCVDSYGGEDCGREYYSVYEFATQDEVVYIKFQGWCASYVGSEFEEWEFVEPVEKMITVYE